MGVANSKGEFDIILSNDNDYMYTLIYENDIISIKTRLQSYQKGHFDDKWMTHALNNKRWKVVELFLVEEHYEIVDVLQKNLYDLDSLNLYENIIERKNISCHPSNAVRVVTDLCKSIKATHPLKIIIEKHYDLFYEQLQDAVRVAILNQKVDVVEFLMSIKIPGPTSVDLVSFVCLLDLEGDEDNRKCSIFQYFLRYADSDFPIAFLLDKTPSLIFRYFYNGDQARRKQFCELLQINCVPACLLIVNMLKYDLHLDEFMADIHEHYFDAKYLFTTCRKLPCLVKLDLDTPTNTIQDIKPINVDFDAHILKY